MCLSCGCGMPTNDHGKFGNITVSDIQRAMECGDVADMNTVINNIENTWSSMNSNFKDNDQDVDVNWNYKSDDDSDGVVSATPPTADKGDGPGTVYNDPNYLKNNTQYVT